jgi:hypothetical protein
MVILYIYSTCWLMKLVFYECQHLQLQAVWDPLEISGFFGVEWFGLVLV